MTKIDTNARYVFQTERLLTRDQRDRIQKELSVFGIKAIVVDGFPVAPAVKYEADKRWAFYCGIGWGLFCGGCMIAVIVRFFFIG